MMGIVWTGTPVPRAEGLISFYWPSLIGSSGQAGVSERGVSACIDPATYCLTLKIPTLAYNLPVRWVLRRSCVMSVSEVNLFRKHQQQWRKVVNSS